MSIDFEQDLIKLSGENQSAILAMENGGIEFLRQREMYVCRTKEELANSFFGELLSWAELHSERWQKIQTALLQDERGLRRDLRIDNNASLKSFTEAIKEGLVPLGQFGGEYFFDFKDNHFVTLKYVDGSDKPERTEIFFDVTQQREFLVDTTLRLRNLIPENFLSELAKHLRDERTKKEIPF